MDEDRPKSEEINAFKYRTSTQSAQLAGLNTIVSRLTASFSPKLSTAALCHNDSDGVQELKEWLILPGGR